MQAAHRWARGFRHPVAAVPGLSPLAFCLLGHAGRFLLVPAGPGYRDGRGVRHLWSLCLPPRGRGLCSGSSFCVRGRPAHPGAGKCARVSSCSVPTGGDPPHKMSSFSCRGGIWGTRGIPRSPGPFGVRRGAAVLAPMLLCWLLGTDVPAGGPEQPNLAWALWKAASSPLPSASAMTGARYRLVSIRDLMKLFFPPRPRGSACAEGSFRLCAVFIFPLFFFFFHTSAFVLFTGNALQTVQV